MKLHVSDIINNYNDKVSRTSIWRSRPLKAFSQESILGEQLIEHELDMKYKAQKYINLLLNARCQGYVQRELFTCASSA